MNRILTLLLASLVASQLSAAEADYATQQDSADKAFNELEGKPAEPAAQPDKDLELQKKELEIERLKLELEREKLSKQKQESAPAQASAAPAPQAAPAAYPRRNESTFYVGLESYNATGTRTVTVKNSSGSVLATADADIDFSQQALKLGFGALGDNRFTIDILSGRKISNSDTGNELYKDGTGVGLTFDIVMSSLYKPASSSNLLPYLRLGVAVGNYEYLDEVKYLYAEDSATTFELKLGLGLFFQINKTFELEAGYDMQTSALTYKDSSDNTLEIQDQVGGLVVGLNVHF